MIKKNKPKHIDIVLICGLVGWVYLTCAMLCVWMCAGVLTCSQTSTRLDKSGLSRQKFCHNGCFPMQYHYNLISINFHIRFRNCCYWNRRTSYWSPYNMRQWNLLISLLNNTPSLYPSHFSALDCRWMDVYLFEMFQSALQDWSSAATDVVQCSIAILPNYLVHI